ncbi:hypothetical protein BH09PSE5_BH09PSE5_01950 [soil metagenome]
MSGFSAEWLSLREPFDARARARAAQDLRLADWLLSIRSAAARSRSSDGAGPPVPSPLRIVDLACGTGASLRALGPLLGENQQWLVVDHDAALLAHWPVALSRAAATRNQHVEQRGDMLHLQGEGFDAQIERRALDLAADLECLPFDGVTLVTASALFDLVSAEWLARLVAACRSAKAAVMFSLSVDGRLDWNPPIEFDLRATTLFTMHQAADKGFGPSLGPHAANAAERAFSAAGYETQSARSDWIVDGAADAGSLNLQQAMIDGIADAAIEVASATGENAGSVEQWRVARQALASRSVLTVGHRDVIARPRG